MPKGKGGFAAVIAAAGLSSRMGAFKPLLPYGDSTILGSVISAFQQAGAKEIIVVCGHRGEELAAYARSLGARAVQNPDYARSGMLESLLLGLEALAGDYDKVFLTPGDVPRISGALVGMLLRSDAPWAVPLWDGKRGHPVMVSGECLPRLRAFVGEGGLRGALQGIPGGETLPWGDAGILLDADTPEDYQRLLALPVGKPQTGQTL